MPAKEAKPEFKDKQLDAALEYLRGQIKTAAKRRQEGRLIRDFRTEPRSVSKGEPSPLLTLRARTECGNSACALRSGSTPCR